jgi:hypothetical protein
LTHFRLGSVLLLCYLLIFYFQMTCLISFYKPTSYI